jgi:hypothetical protein
MQKREIRLIGLATIIGALAVGAYFYSSSEEFSEAPVTAASPSQVAPERASTAVEVQSPGAETPSKLPEEVSAKVETTPLPVDPLVTQQEELIKGFKDKVKLNITLPGDMKFDELDLDAEVAAIQGNSPDKKLAIFAAPTAAGPGVVASFLQENKSRIPMLGNHDFKISGDTKSIPPPKNSGISRITVIPGGEKNGLQIYAALLERSDKRGTYLLVMEASPNYFETYDGDMDNMLSSISAK